MNGPKVRVKPSTRTSDVYGRIRTDIITAQLAPGTKLSIDRMCERYAVGSSPVREALNRLSSEGLVSQHDQRGFGVLPVSREELADLVRTSRLVIAAALRQAMANGGREWEESLILAHHYLMRTPMVLPDRSEFNPEWEERHRSFHSLLISGCGSKWLVHFCDTLLDLTDRYRHLFLASGGRMADVADDHNSMFEAALNRDADALIRHFDSFSESFEGHLIAAGVLP